MTQLLRSSTLVIAMLVCIGCDDAGIPAQHSVECPPTLKTCEGSSDCFSTCMCESANRSRCDSQCGADKHVRVTDLDESGWDKEWSCRSRDEARSSEWTNADRRPRDCDKRAGQPRDHDRPDLAHTLDASGFVAT